MANRTKIVGNVPIYKGDWVSGTSYYKMNQVTYMGSTFQSKVNNNADTPATVNADGSYNIHANWVIAAKGFSKDYVDDRLNTPIANANAAAVLATEKAGLANTAATNANTKIAEMTVLGTQLGRLKTDTEAVKNTTAKTNTDVTTEELKRVANEDTRKKNESDRQTLKGQLDTLKTDLTALKDETNAAKDNANTAADRANGNVIETTDTIVSLAVVENTTYKYGTLASLTITSIPNSNLPSFIYFTSGTTATTFAYPSGMKIRGYSVPVANARYVISIFNNAVTIVKV